MYCNELYNGYAIYLYRKLGANTTVHSSIPIVSSITIIMSIINLLIRVCTFKKIWNCWISFISILFINFWIIGKRRHGIFQCGKCFFACIFSDIFCVILVVVFCFFNYIWQKWRIIIIIGVFSSRTWIF